jgi:hypothetical protein
VRWDDKDIITHDSLMMISLALMKVIFGNVCLYAFNNARMTAWIFMKFVVDVLPLEANSKSHF